MSIQNSISNLFDFLFFLNIDWVTRILIYIISGGIILGSLIFRKSVANDYLGKSFSAWGGSILSLIAFIIMNHITNIRYSLGVALVVLFSAGFLIGDKLGEGDAE